MSDNQIQLGSMEGDGVAVAVETSLRAAVACRAGAALCTAVLASSNVLLSWSGTSRYGWLAVTALVTAGAGLLPYVGLWLRGRSRGGATDAHDPNDANRGNPDGSAARARMDAMTATYDQLSPVADALARLGSARDPEEASQLRGQAVQAVVGAAARLVGADRARASWFVMDGDVIRPGQVFAGRCDHPHSWFRRGTPAGDDVFAMVESGGVRLYTDTATSPPPGWDASVQREYRTFMAVAVSTEQAPLGMLTIDATTPGDLDRAHLPAARVLASFLLAALTYPAFRSSSTGGLR